MGSRCGEGAQGDRREGDGGDFMNRRLRRDGGPTPPSSLPSRNVKFEAVALTLAGYNSLIHTPRYAKIDDEK